MSIATILPDSEYTVWTDNWKATVNKGGPFSFFTADGEPQTGVKFHFDSLRYLFSVPGLVTIKIRFGLRPADQDSSQQFHPILFGLNSRNEIITPYFISSSHTHHHHYPKDAEGEGNVPQELMRFWERTWHDYVEAGLLNQQMFWLNGDVLQGYNYGRQEIMDALGSFTGISHVHVKFALHQYYSMQPTADLEPAYAYTLGLILYAGVKSDPASTSAATTGVALAAKAGPTEDESGFYDFTAPCPYTC